MQLPENTTFTLRHCRIRESRLGACLAATLLVLALLTFLGGCLEVDGGTSPGSVEKDTSTVPKDTAAVKAILLNYKFLVAGDFFQYELLRNFHDYYGQERIFYHVTDSGSLTLHIDTIDTGEGRIRFHYSTKIRRKYFLDDSNPPLFDSVLTDTRQHESEFCAQGPACRPATTDTFYRFFPADSLSKVQYNGYSAELEGKPIDIFHSEKDETFENDIWNTSNIYSSDLGILVRKRWSRMGQYHGPPFKNGWLTLKTTGRGEIVVKLPTPQ